MGRDGCLDYFRLLSETLEMGMDEATFPGEDGFVVDAEATTGSRDNTQTSSEAKGIVVVVGKAEFKSKETGKGWKEQFIYRFSDFDEQGRIGHWEIWADPLSAWEAVSAGDSAGLMNTQS